MDLVIPCNSCTFLYRKTSLHPRLSSAKRGAFPFECRCKTTSGHQSPVSATSTIGYSFLSIPTHKVTVYDKKQGAVHKFVVPKDQYILHTTKAQNITLPLACRDGIVL